MPLVESNPPKRPRLGALTARPLRSDSVSRYIRTSIQLNEALVPLFIAQRNRSDLTKNIRLQPPTAGCMLSKPQNHEEDLYGIDPSVPA